MVGSALPFWGLMAFTFVLLLAPQTVFPVLATVRIALVIGAATIAANTHGPLHSTPPSRISPVVHVACWRIWSAKGAKGDSDRKHPVESRSSFNRNFCALG